MTAIVKDCDKLTITITVFEIKLPITGSKPAKNVMSISVFTNGR